MKLKKIVLILLNFLTIMINGNQNTDLRKYMELEIKCKSIIRRDDLPSEFSDEAFNLVDEFIRKTIDLDYEILIIFDYVTGEIVKCNIGSEMNVKITFDNDEFKGKKIASIHNHTKDMYTPPSDKNFGIFSREWEDYELIAGNNKLWILKAKIKDEKLTFELKINSNLLFNMTLDYYSNKDKKEDEKNDKIDNEYGNLLKNYINNKNESRIQLTEREYSYD